MRQIFKHIYLFSALLATHNSYADNLANKTVILTTHNRAPFSYFIPGIPHKVIADSSFKGRSVNIVRCAFERMAIPLEIHVHPWPHAQQLVKNGEAAGFFSASRSIERDSFAIFSAEIAEQDWDLAILKDNPLTPDQKEFKEKARIAAFAGSNMLYWLKTNGYKVTEAKTPHDLWRLLINKKVDAIMESSDVLKLYAHANRYTNKINIHHQKYKPLGIYMAKDFVDEMHFSMEFLNQNIKICRNEG